MKTTLKEITLEVEVPELDELNYRDEVDQVQFNLSMVLHNLSGCLIGDIVEYGDPMHRPDGALVNAARGLLNIEAARMSNLAGKYNKALVAAQIASWDILRMPADTKNTTSGRDGLSTEEDIRAHLGITPPV